VSPRLQPFWPGGDTETMEASPTQTRSPPAAQSAHSLETWGCGEKNQPQMIAKSSRRGAILSKTIVVRRSVLQQTVPTAENRVFPEFLLLRNPQARFQSRLRHRRDVDTICPRVIPQSRTPPLSLNHASAALESACLVGWQDPLARHRRVAYRVRDRFDSSVSIPSLRVFGAPSGPGLPDGVTFLPGKSFLDQSCQTKQAAAPRRS